MTSNRMHADELTISLSLVYRLIAAQFPRWAHLPLRPVPSTGTDNALYRLGDELVVRLPRINWAADLIDKECLWLPKLAPYLPFAIPVPLAQGEPDENYPWRWAIFRWIEGDPATIDTLPDPEQTAIDLAAFITALHRIDATDGPPPGADDLARGKPLALRDPSTRQAIAALDSMIDAPSGDCRLGRRAARAGMGLRAGLVPRRLIARESSFLAGTVARGHRFRNAWRRRSRLRPDGCVEPVLQGWSKIVSRCAGRG
nr:phosphotransferase [Roseiflexus sp.]